MPTPATNLPAAVVFSPTHWSSEARGWAARASAGRGARRGTVPAGGADRRDPEVLYERNWAFALLNEGWERLALEWERSGRSDLKWHQRALALEPEAEPVALP